MSKKSGGDKVDEIRSDNDFSFKWTWTEYLEKCMQKRPIVYFSSRSQRSSDKIPTAFPGNKRRI